MFILLLICLLCRQTVSFIKKDNNIFHFQTSEIKRFLRTAKYKVCLVTYKGPFLNSQAASTHLKAFLQNNEASQLFPSAKQPDHDASKQRTQGGCATIRALCKEQTRDSCLMVGGRCSLNFVLPEVLVL